MHHVLFLTGCICTLMLVWFGVSFHSAWVMAVIVVSVCVLGIPHGGLDHLSGKKWLAPTWGSYWFVPFGSVYLGIAVVTVAGWLIYPFMTAISFFIISANHFGREQQLDKLASRWNVIRAIGSGGLVIWVPAWMRPAEMTQVLQAILPQSIGSSGETIVDGTQVLSLLFIPVAIVDAVHAITSATVRSQGGFDFAIRQLTLAVISAVAPIPFSFCLFFCGWHSIRGLNQLMKDHHMTLRELVWASLPMTLGAIGLCGLGMWFWQSGRELSAELTRTLFLGLSGMAVPHLVLHDIIPQMARRTDGLHRLPIQGAA
jgi:Brp/Blh family beta-carotene 15,15'-monooxygenase